MARWKAPIYRKSYRTRYGPSCFLEPKTLRYPVCTHGRLDCKALYAAQYYARLSKNKKVLEKIRKTKKHCRRY